MAKLWNGKTQPDNMYVKKLGSYPDLTAAEAKQLEKDIAETARRKGFNLKTGMYERKTKDSTDRRARLHRALDAVMDRAGARDGVIDPSTVSRVYSGRPGCMCGCQGNYSTNPATIKLICNKIAALGGTSTPDWHTAETPSRSYTAYLKKGKYAKDSRPTHRD